MVGISRTLPSNVWGRLIPLVALAGAAFFGAHVRLLWLILLIAIVGSIVLLRQPLWGLFAMIVVALLVPLEFGTGTEVKINLVTLLTPALLGIWMLRMVRYEGIRWVSSRVNQPLLLFLLANVLSLMVGKVLWDPTVTYPGNFLLVQLAQCALFAFLAGALWLTGNLVRDEDTLRRMTYCFLALAGSLAILMMLPGGMGLVNRMATFAVMRAPFWLLLMALASGQLLFNHNLSAGWRWFLFVTLVAVLFYAFGLQRERLSNMVAVTAVAAVLIWLRWPRLGRVLAVLALICAIAFFPTLYNFAGGDAKWEESGGSRLALISRVTELTLRNPITGLGPAAYRPYGKAESFFYKGAYYRSMWLSSHNNYVDLFSHSGLLGLGLFLWFAVEVIRLGWGVRSRFTKGFTAGYINAMLAAWVGALGIMMLADWILPFVYNIGFPGFQASVLVWLFLGGLVALEHMEPRTPQA